MQARTGVEYRAAAGTRDSRGADAQLQYAIERDMRAGQERSALALHLSQLLPPAPRPHHRRIARAILDDAAQAYSGQVFARANGDMVLIGDQSGAASVRDTLARLFRGDAPRTDRLLSLWVLPQETAALEGYLAQTATLYAPPPEPSAPLATIGAMETLLHTTRLTDLIRRQTAVKMVPGGIAPLYRELTFSMNALDAGVGADGSAQADPYLFRHLAGRFDVRMMEVLTQELARAGTVSPGPALHVNLTLQAILSPGFLRLAETARAASAPLGVEIALMDACSDPLAFGAARMVLRAHGCTLVLDALNHTVLLLTHPETLEPDLVKLDWMPRMAQLAPRERRLLSEAIHRIGKRRVVLHRAESEAAIAWGAAMGITRFQGRHVDAMLAASRLAGCTYAGGCTLRQCMDRGSATGAAGRAGCRDTHRLDSAAPTQAAMVA